MTLIDPGELHGPDYVLRSSAEEQRCEVGQVAAPDHPGMSAGSFDVLMLDGFGSEPGAEIAIVFDQVIVSTAGYPEQVKLLVGFRVERGKFFVELWPEAAGAERADPGKLIQSIQASEQRF